MKYKWHLFCNVFTKDGLGEIHVHNVLPFGKPHQIAYRSLRGDWFDVRLDTATTVLAASDDAMVVAQLLDREITH